MRSVFAFATATLASVALASPPTYAPQTYRVPGKAFDRFAIIWLENTDYDKAVGDRMFSSSTPSAATRLLTIAFCSQPGVAR
jgi:hypothetical protein